MPGLTEGKARHEQAVKSLMNTPSLYINGTSPHTPRAMDTMQAHP